MMPLTVNFLVLLSKLRSAKAILSVKEFELKLENTKSVDNRIALIRTFSIPNAKEDIYDFFILAISNIEAGGEETDAWLAKLEQTYQKARLLFGSNSDFSYFQELYEKAKKQKSQMKTMFLRVVLSISLSVKMEKSVPLKKASNGIRTSKSELIIV